MLNKNQKERLDAKTIEQVLDSLPEAVLIMDWKGSLIYANEPMAELAGHKNKQKLLKKNIFSLVHPDSKKDILKDFIKSRTSNGRYIALYKITNKRGEIRWVESLGDKIIFGNKKLILATLRDVTEKKTKEEKYRLLAENSSDVIYILDLKKNKYTYVTPSVEKMLGYTPEEAMGLSPEKILTPKSFEIQINAMRQALKNKKQSLKNPQALELEAVRKDGSILWVEVNAKFLLDRQGRPYAILGISRDISDRREAQEKIKINEKKYRSLFDNSLNVLIGVDKHGKIIEANKTALKLFGYSQEDLKEKHFRDFIPLKYAPILLKDLIFEMRGIKTPTRIIEIKNKKGELVSFEFSGGSTPIYEGVKKIGVLISGKDVSERQTAEKKIADAESQRILSEKKFKEIYEKSPIGIELYDKNGKLTNINKATINIFGISGIDDVKGFNLFDDPNISPQIKTRLKNKKEASYESWFDFEKVKEFGLYKTKKSGKIFITVSITPIIEKSDLKYLVQIQDITNKKESEEKVKIQRDLALSLNKSDSIEKAAKALFQNILSLKEIDAGGLYIREADKLKLKYSSGLSSAFIQKSSFYLENSPQYQLIKRGREVFADYNKLPVNKDSAKQKEKIKAIGILPLKNGQEVLGAINVASHTHANFSQQTKDFLKIIAGQVQQIILRLKKEEALKESEKRHRIVTEKTGNLVYDYNVASGEIKWFGAIKKTTGYSPEEFADFDIHSWEGMVHPDDREDVLKKLEKAKNSIGKYNVEYRMRQKNGKYSFVEEHGVFISNGNKKAIRMFGAVKNVTDKKISENKLKDSESRYRLLSEASAEGIVVVDTKGKFKYANPAFEDLSGYSRRELLKYTYKKLFSENSTKKAEANFGKMMMGEVWTTKNNEYRLKTKDGNLRDIEISSSVIKKDGKINGLMSVIRDISNKKAFEKQLKEKVEELEEINRLMVSRELKMVELKKKVEELENKLAL